MSLVIVTGPAPTRRVIMLSQKRSFAGSLKEFAELEDFTVELSLLAVGELWSAEYHQGPGEFVGLKRSGFVQT
jgi:hypothetical protein